MSSVTSLGNVKNKRRTLLTDRRFERRRQRSSNPIGCGPGYGPRGLARTPWLGPDAIKRLTPFGLQPEGRDAGIIRSIDGRGQIGSVDSAVHRLVKGSALCPALKVRRWRILLKTSVCGREPVAA